MKPADKSTYISADELLAYIFQLLPPEKEAALEQYFDENHETAEIVEGLMDYCLENDLKDPQAFYSHIKKKDLKLELKFKMWQELSEKRSKNQTYSTEGKVKPLNHNSIWIGAIAASLAILLTVLLFPSGVKKDILVDTQQLYDQFAPKLVNLRLGGGTSSADSMKWVEGVIASRNEVEFERAMVYLEEASADTLRREKALYYIGHLAIVQENFSKAALAFEATTKNISPGNETPFYWASQFYQIIVLQGEGKIEEAIDLGERIKAQKAHPYQSDAKKILKVLTKTS